VQTSPNLIRDTPIEISIMKNQHTPQPTITSQAAKSPGSNLHAQVIGHYFAEPGSNSLTEFAPNPVIVGPACQAKEATYGEVLNDMKSGGAIQMRGDAWNRFVELLRQDPAEASTRFQWLQDDPNADPDDDDITETIGYAYIKRPAGDDPQASVADPAVCGEAVSTSSDI